MNFDPSFMALDKMHAWELYSANVMAELRQSRDEGRDVEQYEKLAEAIAGLDATPVREALADIFYKAVMEAPIREGYPYVEPSDLEGIRAARPADRLAWMKPEKNEALSRKFLGAWMGRVCGCLLGKPVEGWRTPDLHKLLKETVIK